MTRLLGSSGSVGVDYLGSVHRGGRADKGHGVMRSVGGSGGAVGALAAVGAVGQEAELSKSLCQLPVKPGPHHRPWAPPGRAGPGHTHPPGG